MAKTNGEDSQNVSNSCKEDEAVLLRPQLPDDIIRQILRFIPTKSAFRISLLANQFEGAWCSGPEIELDEGNTDGGINFTNVLKRYLKFRTESKDLHPEQSLFKFRVRMAIDDPVREDILEKLLIGFGEERSIIVLDLSCLTIPSRPLSLQTLLHMNSLTNLSLESVRVKGDAAHYVRIEDEVDSSSDSFLQCLKTMSLKSVQFPYDNLAAPDVPIMDEVVSSTDLLLPFLKTMSLKSMQLPYDNFSDMLISRCPSIEKISVTSCCFDMQQYSLSIPRSNTLNSLEFRDCNFRWIHVETCSKLESFTLVSESPDVERLNFFRCNSLKKIEILEKHLECIAISAFDSRTNCVEITLDTPNLTSFTLNSKDMRHKIIEGQGSFTHFSDYYYLQENLKKLGIESPSQLFRRP